MAGRAMRVRVEGSRQARDSLRRAGADLDDLKTAHADIAAIVLPEAASRAPRGRTGRLSSSGRPFASKRDARVAFGGGSVRYARPIHWGWPARGIAPDLFLVEGVRATQPRWTAVYRQAVQRILDRVRGA
jgi:hypothetical protein